MCDCERSAGKLPLLDAFLENTKGVLELFVL
jgi:hypothetical protein